MTSPQPKIGFWTLLALVMGNMIGAGVFSLPASLARYGSISLLGWGFTAMGALLLALVFSKLSKRMPRVGGPYAYCKEGLGDFMGFQVAWNYWVSMWVGSVATVVMVVGYLEYLCPTLANVPHGALYVGLSIIWGLSLLNIFSIRGSGEFQVISTLLKLLPLLAVIFWGLPHMNMSHFDAFNVSQESTMGAFMATATLTMWTFIGLESATIPFETIENPKRSIPIATTFGTLIVGALYISAQTVLMGLIPNQELQATASPFALAAQQLFGSWGAIFVAIGAIMAALGSLNGFIFIQSQIPMAAARDGLFPHFFSRVSSKGIPQRGMFITACIMSGVLVMNYSKSLVEQFTFLITLATLAALTTYFFSTLSEIILYIKQEKTMKFPLFLKGTLISLGALGYSVWAIIGSGTEVIFYGSFLFLLSAPFYVLTKVRRG